MYEKGKDSSRGRFYTTNFRGAYVRASGEIDGFIGNIKPFFKGIRFFSKVFILSVPVGTVRSDTQNIINKEE
jgi:hypothetical protein